MFWFKATGLIATIRVSIFGGVYIILGEKIQQLRKKNNLSQEQLAEQLSVSRQSISKWELSESIPDTNKIVQLSKAFQVSTDYLLLDDIDIDSDRGILAVKKNSELIKKQYNVKTLFIVCTGISIIGLFMSFVAFFTWTTILSHSVGMIVQIIGYIIFESISIRYTTENERKIIRKHFYSINVWLISPIPVIYFSEVFANRIDYEFYLLCTVIVYFIFCGIITLILRRKTKKN